MKRTVFIVVMAMMSVVGMAQHHHGDHHGDHRGGHKDHHEPPRQEMRYVEPATPEQVMMVLQVMDKQNFDDNKLDVAKLSVCLGHFYVRDMMRMGEKFSFDDKRKEFFIFAYPYCLDPENYYIIRDVFSFRSNFDEVMERVMPGYRR